MYLYDKSAENQKCHVINRSNHCALLMSIAGYSTKVFSHCHYRNFLLRVQVNAIERLFAVAIMRNSLNDYSKYLLYCIYLYSQREIPMMRLGKNFSAIICYKHQQCVIFLDALSRNHLKSLFVPTDYLSSFKGDKISMIGCANGNYQSGTLFLDVIIIHIWCDLVQTYFLKKIKKQLNH